MVRGGQPRTPALEEGGERHEIGPVRPRRMWRQVSLEDQVVLERLDRSAIGGRQRIAR